VSGWIDPAGWDTRELAARWRAARPFPHLVIDALAAPAARGELLEAFGEEPASKIHDEIFEVLASAKEVEHAAFRRFQRELGGPELRAALGRVTAKELSRVEMRAYAFFAGDYLLPHADHQDAIGRAIAYAYYGDCEGLEGGELELFGCELEGREVVATAPTLRIAPAANRIVFFEVSDRSLHQVCEVIRGRRLSLSGWFYP
jgi:Rps23 Pro-64 3,4-dihydroxylase Tpa1-like proline 4-hydroxylase